MSEPVRAEKGQNPVRNIRSDELIGLLSSRVVGQAHALEHIVPSIQLHLSGLAPEGRPVGVFLLLGPTGTGKTRTVEALAEVLHGDARSVIKIDCGEFQSEHEVAKLIGAPPGYVGHAQTEPRLNQLVLDETTSAECDLSLVLFDEIEKAAASLSQLLLGVLDKATLRLGDGGEVNFEKSLIFLTSNLGARDMVSELQPGLGFDTEVRHPGADLSAHLERVGLRAVQRHFSPEFVNRIDAVYYLSSVGERVSGGDPRTTCGRTTAPCPEPTRQQVVRHRGGSSGPILYARKRDEHGVWSEETAEDHPPSFDPAAGCHGSER